MGISLEIFSEQTYLQTATERNLDNRAADFAITRRAATFALRIAEMTDTDGNPFDPPIDSRFSAPNVSGGINFTVVERISSGRAMLECERSGTVGNEYLGALLPLFPINNLGTATMTGTQIPAEDTETDDELRARVIERINRKAYGGNVADYREFTTAIDGVGSVRVFPIWDGGDTLRRSQHFSGYARCIRDNAASMGRFVLGAD